MNKLSITCGYRFSLKQALCLVLSGMVLLLLSELTLAQDVASHPAEKLVRELYVPFEQLDVLIGSDTNRIYMSREEFVELKKLAHQQWERELPLKQTLLSATYQATIEEGRAVIAGEIELELLEEGWHAFHLPFEGVGIRSAQLDDGPAAFAKDEQGQTLLFATGVGKHRLKLDIVMPIKLDAAQQTMQFRLPSAPVGTLSLKVPGNVEIRSGAQVLRRDFIAEEEVTVFELLPTGETLSILLSLNNKTLKEDSMVLARGVLVSEITQGYERLHATLSMRVMNGATDEFRFKLAEGLEVNSVTSESLSRWSIDSADGSNVLIVKLHSATTDRVVINARLDRPMKQLNRWQFPRLEPLDVEGYSAVFGVLVEERLSASAIEADSLIPIDTEVLTSALPASVLAADSDSPPLKPIAAFYSPDATYDLTADFSVQPRRLTVTANSVVLIDDGGMTVSGGFRLLPKHEKLFFVDFLCPKDWTVNWVRTNEQVELKFNRFAANESEAGLANPSAQRIRVSLPQGVPPNGETTLLFQAQHTPESWLSDWQTQTIELPRFPLLDADNQQGAVAVQLNDDLTITPTVTEGVLVMTNDEKARFHLKDVTTSLAYRYDSVNWQAAAEIRHVTPQMSAEVLSFLQLQTELLVSHTELIVTVDQARTQRVQFSLPEATPQEVSVRGLGSVVVKETTSEIIEGRRIWTVQLAERLSGDLRFAIDFTQKREADETQSLVLPIVRAVGVDYQSGKIAVEGHPELDIELPTHPRSVDSGELVDAEYQVGKRLLGVYAYVGTDDVVLSKTKRIPVHRLPTTIIQRVELVTLIAAQGIHQTAARFQLRSKAEYLEVRLPAGAELWSVTLDGKPTLPQRERDHVLVPLPPLTRSDMRDLQLVYESPTSVLGLRSDVGLVAPELLERQELTDVSLMVPIADVKWDLVLPTGYRVASVDGNLSASNHSRQSYSLNWFIKQWWDLGGGRTKGGQIHSMLAESSHPTGDTAYFEHSKESYNEPTATAPRSSLSDLQIDNAFGANAPQKPADPFADRDQPLVPSPMSEPAPMSESAPAEPAARPAAPVKAEDVAKDFKQDKLWALDGVRTLLIHLDSDLIEDRFELTSLGVDPRATATIVHQVRWNWLSLAVGALVFTLGMICHSRNRFSRFLVFAVLLACVLPPLVGWEDEFASWTHSVLIAVLLLITYRLLRSVTNRWMSYGQRKLQVISKAAMANQAGSSPASSSITAVVLWLCLFSGDAVVAQETTPAVPTGNAQIITTSEQLSDLLLHIGAPGKLAVPEDAVIVPYDSEKPVQENSSEKLLVPYSVYIELLNLADPEKKLVDPKLPVTHAWSDAEYSIELDGEDSLRMQGSLTLEQFVDGELAIPFTLAGCVLEAATLDGKASRIQAIEAQAQPLAQQAVAADATAPTNALFMLHSRGKGSKRLEVNLRWKLAKQSGWRSIEGTILSSLACKLTVNVPSANTEVRLPSANDRALHETTQPNESIVTSLSNDGKVSIRWRDKIAKTQLDQGLTVQAQSVFDIQEESVKFAWHAGFEFRNGLRESLALQVPNDYLIEKVAGDNVRGWTMRENNGVRQIEVELLKAVSERERITVLLSKSSPVTIDSVDILVPQVTVPDAMLQQGQVTVRRSLMFDMRSLSTEGVTRIDAPDESTWFAAHEEPGPLPLRTFQAYRYAQVPFEIKLSVATIPLQFAVQQQTLLKLSQRDSVLETRLLIRPAQRSLYKLAISLPVEWVLDDPEISGDFQWSRESTDNRQQLDIYLANGRSEEFPIILRGKLKQAIEVDSQVELPTIQVANAASSSGAVVVQADPAFDVRAESLVNCETTLLDSVQNWLAPNQRESARLAIRFENASYSGNLRIAERAAVVSSTSITNIKVTDRSIEETILIEANIRGAGIREYRFELPARMSTAKIQAPLLRQKKIIPIEGRNDVVLVELLLQNDLIGQFRVVVEQDRELTDDPQTAPVPTIVTGKTAQRIITLENASRDEVVAKETKMVEKLDRASLLQRLPNDLLGGKSSEGYVVLEGENEPLLNYQTNARETLLTAGARIGLSQALVVVDEMGAYRVTQELRVESRTEPFLEVELPTSSQLWTVSVAGEPVKPANVKGTANHKGTRVRIPLVKSAEGDLDYPVVLKFGGQLSRPGWFKRIEIPLIRTININVELSQVRLRLPEDYRWFNFDGTLGQVESEGDLQAGWLSFRTRQVAELTQLLGSAGAKNPYSQMRASNNLKQLEESIAVENRSRSASARDNSELQKQLNANSAALQNAQQQIQQLDEQQADDLRGNREILNEFYDNQFNGRSLNALESLGQNFAAEQRIEASGKPASGEKFQSTWLSKNNLELRRSERESKDRVLRQSQVDAVVTQEFSIAAPIIEEAKKFSKANTDQDTPVQRSEGMQSQARRYGDRLQQQSSPFGGGMGSGEMREGVMNQRIDVGGMANGAMGGGVIGGMGGMGGMGGVETPAAQVQGFMSSLDVELPIRGQEYLFTTPRGNVELSVQSLSNEAYRRFFTVITLLLIGVFAWKAFPIIKRLIETTWGLRVTVTLLALFGTLSITLGLLPIYGCLIVLAAVAIASR